MINFSLNRPAINFRRVVNKSVDASYLKNFNQAIHNLELNILEERRKRAFNA